MLDKNVIPAEILQEIEEDINAELAKRCYPKVEVTLGEDRQGNVRFKISSKPFNTVPALMKSIVLNDWITGTSLQTQKIVLGKDEPEIVEMEYVDVRITVLASYEHWDGGGNGCKVFTYTAKIWENYHGGVSLGEKSTQ